LRFELGWRENERVNPSWVRLLSVAAANVLLACGGDDEGGASSGGTSAGGTSSGGATSGGGTSSGGGAGTGGAGTGGAGAGGTGATSAGGAPSGCALPSYPDESCTGVPPGTTLTLQTGDLTLDVPNQVVEGLDIQGCVLIEAPGVVIRRSKITCDSFLAVASYASSYTGTGALLEDVEISCAGQAGTAVGDYNVTVRRANIHSCENGFDADGAITVEDSFIHDLLPYDPVSDPHVDGIQITPVGQDIVIRHNTIHAGSDGNAAIICPNLSAGLIENVTIESNLLAGGGYTVYCQQYGSGNNFRINDNHFSTLFHPTVGAFGPWTECEDETEVSGNVIHETGAPLP
jgi:hypothetical protein